MENLGKEGAIPGAAPGGARSRPDQTGSEDKFLIRSHPPKARGQTGWDALGLPTCDQRTWPPTEECAEVEPDGFAGLQIL